MLLGDSRDQALIIEEERINHAVAPSKTTP
jgi:hypothetical protein